ncbi:MAG: immunoglobulin-like domain-containing protein [Faecousia sp.]
MKHEIVYYPHPKPWKWALGLLLLLVLLGVTGWAVLFRFNRFTLSVQIAGEEQIQLEYGQEYREPGARTRLTGTLFWKDGLILEDVQPTVSGQVDTTTLGRYTLTYSADFRGFHGEARRTVCVVDTQSPVITLVEAPEGELDPGEPYQDPGFTAMDNYDGDITDQVVCIETMGLITYAVVDSSGNPAYAEREIPVYDREPPEIGLEGGQDYAITTGSFYMEPGYWAEDDQDGDLTEQVLVEGEVDWLTPGTYPISYTVSDAFGNVTTVTRQVEVLAKPRPQIQWPQQKTIYLTFDDGPGPYTRELLDVLDSYGVKATFFVTDTGCDDIMEQIVERGHSIGIHTVTHDYQEIYASPEAFFADLHKMQDIIYKNTGVRTTLMRFPGGSSNTVSCAACEGIMTILSEAVQNAGFQYFDWNVDSNDAGGARKAETVFRNVVDGVQQTGISLVLQHDIHDYSVEAVEDIIVWGLNNGYTFERLTENSPGFHHGINN